MTSEKQRFQQDLLDSVKQMRTGYAARVTVSLNLPPEVIERWKTSGPDWQSRMEKLLCETQPSQ